MFGRAETFIKSVLRSLSSPVFVCASSVSSLAPITFILDVVITILTGAVLAGKLRRTEDLFFVSQEIQRAGCCMVASVCEHSVGSW